MPSTRRLAAAGGALLGGAILAAALHQWVTWPDVGALATEAPRTTAFMRAFEAEQERAGSAASATTEWVAYERISDHLKAAVLVAEDINFFSHNGFEVGELTTAVRDTLREGRPLRGASTLSQQLVKNLWLSPSRNPWRKLKEALLTRQLERRLSKRRILELYLNLVEFGPGIYGAEAAARHFFAKPASRLTPAEAAALAAGLPSSRWYPGATSDTYRARVESTLRRMRKATWIFEHL